VAARPPPEGADGDAHRRRLGGDDYLGIDVNRAARIAAALSDVWRSLGCFEAETKGSGTATVLAALVTFYLFGRDFREAVLVAINQLGADTDTIGGFVRGLCGAYHGYENVPPEWASELQDYDYFSRVATELARIAARKGMGSSALLPRPTKPQEAVPNLLDRIRQRDIAKGERIYHPLFGTGWVEFVEEQALRRRDGAQAVFAHVRFDIGQSCKFRFIRIPKKKKRSSREAKQRPSKDENERESLFDDPDPKNQSEVTGELSPEATELVILRGIAAGQSTRDLARELGIPSAEVVAMLRHLLGKLGAANANEALAEAKRRGLLGK
jgi:DNA-binding CsgD family transcriptional regulator